MRKFLPLLAALLVLPGFAAAEPAVTTGEVTVAYGWVKKADGTKVDISGMKLPYRAYPVRSHRLDLPFHKQVVPSEPTFLQKLGLSDPLARSNSNGGGPMADAADTVVYNANAGLGYGYVENNPSSLDDINMTSAGVGKPWTKLTFGMQYNSSSFSPFIIRWRCYGTNIDNPAPQTDFTDEFADFGVRWTQNLAVGGSVVEIDVSQAAVSTSDTSFFVAQQFREPHPFGPFGTEDGEGAFEMGIVDTVFNAFAPPTTGTSLNQFWYDWDPVPDGAYENTEVDVFDGGEADHVFTIKVSTTGQSSELTALNASMGLGRFVSGNLLSVLSANDGNEFKIFPGYNGTRQDPVGSIQVDFFQPTATISGIRLSGRVGVDVLGIDEGLDLYDFVDNKWIQVNSMVMPNGFITFNEAYGGLVPLSHFTGTVNHPILGPVPAIRARVRFINTVFNLPKNWTMKLDLMKCNVTTG